MRPRPNNQKKPPFVSGSGADRPVISSELRVLDLPVSHSSIIAFLCWFPFRSFLPCLFVPAFLLASLLLFSGPFGADERPINNSNASAMRNFALIRESLHCNGFHTRRQAHCQQIRRQKWSRFNSPQCRVAKR